MEDLIQKVSERYLMFMREKIYLKDKKSMAINVTIQSSDKTLKEKDLDRISQKIISTVEEKTGATIRS